jgi:hypothetical protein
MFSVTEPPRIAMETYLPRLVELGCEVELVTRRAKEPTTDNLPVTAHHARAGVAGDPARLTPRWLTGVWRHRVIRRAASKAKPLMATWLVCSRDDHVLSAARDADVLVALDRYAVYTVWRLAKRNTDAIAVHGLTEAVLRLEAAAGTPDPA